jgi:magnesium-protoporphyrin IX monomethyl ester (oxidative) cyclase
MGYRAMSTETALRQFQRLFRFAPWCTTFSCTDNIMPKPYPREVFSRLVPPPNVSVFYEVKLPLSERDLRAMSAAQVNRVQPGVEALATDTLQLMGKGTTAFQNIQFLKNCIRYAIAAGWNLLIGFPGEKPEIYEKYAKDIPLLLHLPPPAGVYMVRFDRFSPYYTRASEFGLTLQPLDFYHLTYPFPAEDLEKMAYFFADQEISPYILDAVSWLGPLNELVEAWSRAWHERAVPPQLVLRDGDNGRREILDTRGQLPLVIEVNESEERLLRRLTSPAREERLATELDLPEVEMTGLLARFDERQLLFREGGQVLSLVLPAGGSAVESAIEAEPPETAIETEPHETAFVPVSAIGRPGSVEAAGNS